MTTFTDRLRETLANANNAMAGVFLRNHAEEIIALVEAAEKYHCKGGSTYGERGIVEALAALEKVQS